jgi:uncharacterized RDD family membrane protein YckC
MAIEDFKMYEEWAAYRDTLASQPVEAQPRPVVLAGWGSRFGAYLIDSILLSIPILFFAWEQFRPMMESFAASATIDPVTGQPDPASSQDFISGMVAMNLRITVIFALLATVYYVVCHGAMGQTLGKMLVGIKLIRVDGEDPSFVDAAKRALVNPIATVIPMVGSLITLLNGLWPLWDERKQSLGDKIAKTLVVRD